MSETSGKALEDLTQNMRRENQRLASLEQDARQPCLAMKVDITAHQKTRERTEGAAAAVEAKHGDSCSAKRVQAGPKSSTGFGMKAEAPALPRRDDVLIDNGAAAPKSCFSPLEMRTPTVTGGLLPAGKASPKMRITYSQPRLRFCPPEETNSERTSIQYASYYSSFWWINNQLAAPSWQRVIQTKLRTLEFDPRGATGRLRACPFFRNVARIALWGAFR